MRKVRMAVSVLFVFSCIVFTVYLLKVRLVEDHTPPEIFFEKERIEVSVTADDAELLQDVTAKDNRDGDITDEIRIASMSHFIEKGRRTISYIVFDQANQAASAERTLVYTDYRSPRIYLTKPLRYGAGEAKNVNLLANVRADDCLNGDLSGQIRVSLEDSWYDPQPGDYHLTLQVSNDAGDSCLLPLSAKIVDKGNPEEAKKCYPVLSDYIVYTAVGKPLKLKDYAVGLMQGNKEMLFDDEEAEMTVGAADISIESEVDYDVPGIYEVRYSYTSLEGIDAVTVLYVVVEE